MKNAFARQLMDARNRGVEYGIKGMAMMATIALYNILDNNEDRNRLINEFDSEVYRVWQEFKSETLAKNTDINDLIVGHYERIMREVWQTSGADTEVSGE